MATQADNFTQTMAWAWERGTSLSENAVIRAGALGATKIGPIYHPDFREVHGDMPASLWIFPDNSTLVIFDDGAGIRRVPEGSQVP